MANHLITGNWLLNSFTDRIEVLKHLKVLKETSSFLGKRQERKANGRNIPDPEYNHIPCNSAKELQTASCSNSYFLVLYCSKEAWKSKIRVWTVQVFKTKQNKDKTKKNILGNWEWLYDKITDRFQHFSSSMRSDHHGSSLRYTDRWYSSG